MFINQIKNKVQIELLILMESCSGATLVLFQQVCFLDSISEWTDKSRWVPSDLLCSGHAALRAQITGRWQWLPLQFFLCFTVFFFLLFLNQTRFMNTFKQDWGTLFPPGLNAFRRVGSHLVYVMTQSCKIWSWLELVTSPIFSHWRKKIHFWALSSAVMVSLEVGSSVRLTWPMFLI